MVEIAHKVNEPMAQDSRVQLLMPALVEGTFTYAAPHALPPGTLVEASLARKARIAAVWDDMPDAAVPQAKLKSVDRILDMPPLPAPFRKFIDWVAEFTLAPKGAVLSLAGLAHAAKATRKQYKAPEYAPKLPNLSPAQAEASQQLLVPGKPVVLDGVTGSGKTEVYFHAMTEVMAQGKQVLVLLPEIALTHQWLARFEAAFGAAPALWHSQETPAARARVWQAVAKGEAKVVVGARTALFLPFANLGLIIVDEEHDPSYNQEEGVLYHARDMAVVRARFEGCPLVLASATPSLETLLNVQDGKYLAAHLPSRFGTAELPDVQIVDMVNHPPERGEFLSPLVKEQLAQTLGRGEQSLLFLNRRGYAPLLLCRGCGHRFQCPSCSAWLAIHGKQRLECHHCGHREKMPEACPQCAAPSEKLAACGPGVERIVEEARAMFTRETEPRIALLSSDESIAAEDWAAIERGDVDILVGTQMVAKGHHFPQLTFVGVVDADLGLEGADLRASERSYQLLHQLGGRAGRGNKRGQVFVQTYQPNHPVMKALAAHDRDAVMHQELRMRREGGWPPYGQLAAILLDGVNEANVKRAAQELARLAPHDPRLRLLGPAPAPLSKLRGQYRYRILLKAEKGIHLQKTLRNWLNGKKFSGVRVKLDVNPYYFL
jgi:primosomal protein N' (replication factor Y)